MVMKPKHWAIRISKNYLIICYRCFLIILIQKRQMYQHNTTNQKNLIIAIIVLAMLIIFLHSIILHSLIIRPIPILCLGKMIVSWDFILLIIVDREELGFIINSKMMFRILQEVNRTRQQVSLTLFYQI
jgi:hypothetical protein